MSWLVQWRGAFGRRARGVPAGRARRPLSGNRLTMRPIGSEPFALLVEGLEAISVRNTDGPAAGGGTGGGVVRRFIRRFIRRLERRLAG